MTLLQIEMATNVTLWHLGMYQAVACELSNFLKFFKWISSINKLADLVEGLCVNCYLSFQVDKAIYHSQDILFVSCKVSSLMFVRRSWHCNLSFALQVSVRQAQRLCIEIDIIGSRDFSFLRCHGHVQCLVSQAPEQTHFRYQDIEKCTLRENWVRCCIPVISSSSLSSCCFLWLYDIIYLSFNI